MLISGSTASFIPTAEEIELEMEALRSGEKQEGDPHGISYPIDCAIVASAPDPEAPGIINRNSVRKPSESDSPLDEKKLKASEDEMLKVFHVHSVLILS